MNYMYEEEEELILVYIIDYCNSEVYFLFLCEKLVTDFLPF